MKFNSTMFISKEQLDQIVSDYLKSIDQLLVVESIKANISEVWEDYGPMEHKVKTFEGLKISVSIER